MDTPGDALTTSEFKRIMLELWEHSPQTRVRFRLMGKMWNANFLQVIHITSGDAIIVQEKDKMKHISIREVIQSELDGKFRDLKPHFHYKVGVS